MDILGKIGAIIISALVTMTSLPAYAETKEIFVPQIQQTKLDGNAHMTKARKDILTNKPYFTLRLEIENAAYIVDLNGVTLISDMEAGATVKTEIPVNHWMRTGDNTISLTLVSFPEHPVSPHANATVSLQVKPSGQSHSETEAISRLEYAGKLANTGMSVTAMSTKPGAYNSQQNFYADERGDVRVSEVQAGASDDGDKKYSQTVSLTTPFPEWAFFRSDMLPEESIETMSDDEFQRFLDEPFAVYKKVSTALRIGDLVTVMRLFEERNREYDLASFSEPGTKEKELVQSLKKVLSRPQTELVELKKENCSTFFQPNKKLFKLFRNGTNEAIAFNLRDLDVSQYYEILLRREKGQWIITR